MVFSQFRSLSIRKSAFVNVLKFSSDIISRLVCQSKFQLFIYTTLRPPCWRTKEVFQHGGSILSSIILGEHFDEYLKFGTTHARQTLYLVSIIQQFLDFIFCMDFVCLFDFFYCVTMQMSGTRNVIGLIFLFFFKIFIHRWYQTRRIDIRAQSYFQNNAWLIPSYSLMSLISGFVGFRCSILDAGRFIPPYPSLKKTANDRSK